MDLYDQILAIEMPAVVNPDFRKESRKAWAAGIRTLFKQIGLKGISVTAPRYSMAQAIDIRLPRDINCAKRDELDRRRRAKEHLTRIVLAAYPGTSTTAATACRTISIIVCLCIRRNAAHG
jgi:hypothetical protein